MPALVALVALWLAIAGLWWGVGIIRPLMRRGDGVPLGPLPRFVIAVSIFIAGTSVLLQPSFWGLLAALVAPPVTALLYAGAVQIYAETFALAIYAGLGALALAIALSRIARRPRTPWLAVMTAGALGFFITAEITTHRAMSAGAEGAECFTRQSLLASARQSFDDGWDSPHAVIARDGELHFWSYKTGRFHEVYTGLTNPRCRID